MKKGGVKVTIYVDKLEALDVASQKALELTAEAIHTEVVQAQVIPYKSGHLQNDSTFVDASDSVNGHVDLVSSTPYARRLYYHPEYRFSHAENPNAGAGWFDAWAQGGARASFAGETFAALFKREAGL